MVSHSLFRSVSERTELSWRDEEVFMRRILLSFFLLLTSRSFAQFQAYGYQTDYPGAGPRPLPPSARESHFNSQSLVFEVRKSIPLSSTEKVTRDYYINSGTKKGIRKGSVVKVYRKTAVYDPFYNRLSQDLKIEVAELKIIHAEHNVSIGRIYSVGESDDKVALDYQAPMVGDSLDVASARMPGSIGNNGMSNNQEGLSSSSHTLGDLKYLDPDYHRFNNQNRDQSTFQPPDQTANSTSDPMSNTALNPASNLPFTRPVEENLTQSLTPPSLRKSGLSGTPPVVIAPSTVKLEAGNQETPPSVEDVTVQVQ